jgi:hypothetical protein
MKDDLDVLRLDSLLGREVTAGGARIGRIEEFRAEWRGTRCEITEYIIGAAGLWERLDLGMKLLLGRRRGGYIARWDQVDISDPRHPTLTCPVEALRSVT